MPHVSAAGPVQKGLSALLIPVCWYHYQVKKHLGRGYFTTYSEVSNRFMSGFAADTSMMLTKFKASAQDTSGYTTDILALASLRHKNIASCIAVSAEKHPYCTLSEYFLQVCKLGISTVTVSAAFLF